MTTQGQAGSEGLLPSSSLGAGRTLFTSKEQTDPAWAQLDLAKGNPGRAVSQAVVRRGEPVRTCVKCREPHREKQNPPHNPATCQPLQGLLGLRGSRGLLGVPTSQSPSLTPSQSNLCPGSTVSRRQHSGPQSPGASAQAPPSILCSVHVSSESWGPKQLRHEAWRLCSLGGLQQGLQSHCPPASPLTDFLLTLCGQPGRA